MIYVLERCLDEMLARARSRGEVSNSELVQNFILEITSLQVLSSSIGAPEAEMAKS